jgi:Dolichyl-phosphate-mannose-protein mannosyltransferase
MFSPQGPRLAVSALVPSRRRVYELAGRGRDIVRRNWLFAVVAVCATALRVIVQLAYQPALIFPDSERYLQYAHNFIVGQWIPDWLRTSGYSFLLIPAVLTHDLAPVAAVQHLLGLATAVLIYATLVHFGARRWLAALATVPVLFDPLELDIEQYVLTDVIATFLVVAALVVLVWKRNAIGKVAPVMAGLLLAAATIIREPDLAVMIPALLYLVVIIRPRRRLATRAALLLVGFLIPVLGYLVWFQVWFGTFNFITYNSQFVYGRIAQFADCTGMSLPWYERHLCPQQPPAERNPDFYMWAKQSPQVTLQPTAGLSKGQIISDFDLRIIEHQPLTYLKAVTGDVLYSFSPVRGAGPEHYPIAYHQFQTYFLTGKGAGTTVRTYTGRGPRVEPALADFLAGYGRDFYVPGPLLAAGLALGVAGLAGIGRARRSGLRAPCLLFTIAAIVVTESPFLTATFDWRYELPQLSLIPIAAVLGVTALAGWRPDQSLAAPPGSTDPPVHAADASQLVSNAVRAGLPGRDSQSPDKVGDTGAPAVAHGPPRVALGSEDGQEGGSHDR